MRASRETILRSGNGKDHGPQRNWKDFSGNRPQTERNPAEVRHRLTDIGPPMRFASSQLGPSLRLLGAILLASGLSASDPVQAAVSIEEVTVGIAGLYKVGHWTPVEVRLQTDSAPTAGRLRLFVPDGNGLQSVYESKPIQLAAGRATRCLQYVRFGQRSAGIDVEFQAEDGSRWQKRIPAGELPDALYSSQRLILSVGPEMGVAAAVQSRPQWLRSRLAHAHVARLADLPPHWLGFGGLDAIVLATSQLQLDQPLEQERWQAITRWAELGGSVVLAAASRAAMIASVELPLSRMLPGEFERVILQRQTTGIEQFAEATQRLDQLNSSATEFSVPMSVFQRTHGRVEAYEGIGLSQQPAVMRYGIGLGRITFAAFDLDQEPFRDWTDRPRLVAKLLAFALGEQDGGTLERAGERRARTVQGPRDMLGQLRTALDQFESVRFVPFSLTAGLITVYLLLIGPVDYWVLRRYLRLEWTWLTLPLTVVLFLGLAVILARSWKGQSVQIRQAEIVDLDVDSGWIRGNCWTHVFSPKTTRLAPELRVRLPLEWSGEPQQIVSWEGFPSDRFGGMDSSFQPSAFSQPYFVRGSLQAPDQAQLSLEDFPIAVWSSRGLAGRWWGRIESTSANDSSLVEGPEKQLRGSFHSPLARDLSECLLLYDRWIYPLGTVSAKQQTTLEDRPLDLRSWLTRRRIVEGRNVDTPWDPQEVDVDRILQLVMFYGAAHGQNYTQQLHDYERHLDLSDQLRLRRAILVGQVRQPASEVVLRDEVNDNHRTSWTYYRILYPVEREEEPQL